MQRSVNILLEGLNRFNGVNLKSQYLCNIKTVDLKHKHVNKQSMTLYNKDQPFLTADDIHSNNILEKA